MATVKVDLSEIMEELCEGCDSVQYHESRSHDRGFDEPYNTCPAGDCGDGDLLFDADGFFYCRQAGC